MRDQADYHKIEPQHAAAEPKHDQDKTFVTLY
jgi:hypothetical protein